MNDIKMNKNNRKEYKMKKVIAKHLLDIGAVFLRPDEPFTWASGIKSPIYCDNRLTLAFPEVRDAVEQGIADVISTEFPDAEALFGTATAGIAHAAIAADRLGLPMGYVRSGSKDHGRQNKVEGRLVKGQKVVVVEDLISTAGSVIEVVNTLRDEGVKVLGIVSIFTYNLQKGIDRLKEADIVNRSLSDFETLSEVAAENGFIADGDIKRLEAFRRNPSDESWITA